MADPLTIAKAIPAVIEAATKIIIYISKAKNASKTCRKLEIELSNTKRILKMIQESTDEIENDPQSRLQSLQWLGTDNGLLSQILSTLEEIGRKFEKTASSKGLKRFGQSVLWPFNEDEAKAVLDTIIRQKADLMLIYANDSLSLLQDNKKEVSSLLSIEYGISIQMGSKPLTFTTSRLIDLEKSQKNLCTWLSPFNFRARQSDLYQIRTDTTGNWILETTDYIVWVRSSGTKSYLLCEGSPGAGKTIIASVIAQDLFSRFPAASFPGISVVCIFCSYKDKTLHTLSNLLGSVIRQIVGDHGDNEKLVHNLYNNHKLEKDPDYRSLDPQEGIAVLKCMLKDMRRIYIVVDAIDECKDEDMRLEFLKILQGLGSNVSLLMTSRPGFALSQQDAVMVEIKAPDNDLEHYVTSRMQSSDFLRKHTEDDVELRDCITMTVVRRSDHMFLMAALYMDELSQRARKNKRAVKQGLQSLPLQRNELYDLTFSRIEDQDATIVECAKQILSWIVFAPEPLSVVQIQQALATRDGDFSLGQDSMVEPDLLTRVCCGFISLGSKDGLLRASHYTAQDYLESNLDKLFPEEPLIITQTCLDYLIKVCDIESTDQLTWRDWAIRWPLAKVALTILNDHVRDQKYQGPFYSMLTGRTFIACSIATDAIVSKTWPETGVKDPCEVARYVELQSGSWGASLDPKFLSRIFLEFERQARDFSLLHIAARSGANELLTLVLNEGVDIDGVKDLFRATTALALASSHGHSVAVDVLLEAGSNPSLHHVDVPKPLEWAARMWQMEVITKLLQSGADPTAVFSHEVRSTYEDYIPNNLFEHLAVHGLALLDSKLHKEVKKMMVFLKDIQSDVHVYGDVLGTAIRHRCGLTTIEFLLDLGFDPLRKWAPGNALHYAIYGVSWGWYPKAELTVNLLALLLERTPRLNAAELAGYIEEVLYNPADHDLPRHISSLRCNCEIIHSNVLTDAINLFISGLPVQTRCFIALVLLQKPGCDVLGSLSDYNLRPLEVLDTVVAHDSLVDLEEYRYIEGVEKVVQAVEFSPEDLDEIVWTTWSDPKRLSSFVKAYDIFEPCLDVSIGKFAICWELVVPEH